jgi:hypothetical protein
MLLQEAIDTLGRNGQPNMQDLVQCETWLKEQVAEPGQDELKRCVGLGYRAVQMTLAYAGAQRLPDAKRYAEKALAALKQAAPPPR